jgi:hypothetical protein
MRHKETGCERVGVEWNEQDQDRIKKRSTVNMIMNFSESVKTLNFTNLLMESVRKIPRKKPAGTNSDTTSRPPVSLR